MRACLAATDGLHALAMASRQPLVLGLRYNAASRSLWTAAEQDRQHLLTLTATAKSLLGRTAVVNAAANFGKPVHSLHWCA